MIGDLAALILRFDGLILDTEEAEYASVSAIFAEFGLSLGVERWGATIGVAQADGFWLDWLESDLGHPINRHVFLIEQSQRHWEQILRLQPCCGVIELLQEAHSRGVPTVLVSDSPSRWVRRQLERLDLTAEFDSVVTREAAPAPPPFPHLYWEAFRRLGIDRLHRCQTLVVEHSLAGVNGARTAGAQVALCPGRMNRELPTGEPDWLVQSLGTLADKWHAEPTRHHALSAIG